MAKSAVYGDIGDRTGALVVDLTLLFALLILISQLSPFAFLFVLTLAFIYFTVMPLTPIQGTIGQRVLRLKLCTQHGMRLTWQASVLRTGAKFAWFCIPVVLHGITEAYAVPRSLETSWWIFFQVPWLTIEFRPRHESLFDILSNSVVARRSASADEISSSVSEGGRSYLSGLITAAFFLATGYAVKIGQETYIDRDCLTRTGYAVAETQKLRSMVEEFYSSNDRWPTAKELQVPDWNSYPAGGGYRLLESNGVIAITFTVLPELKGHTITLTPKISSAGNSLNWNCSLDPGFKVSYVPTQCR